MRKRNKFTRAETLLLLAFLAAAPIGGYLLLPREQEQYSMLLRDGDYRHAAQTLQSLVDAGDTRPFILPALAKAYQGSGQAKRAAEVMRAYVAQHPYDSESLQQLEALYAEAKMPAPMIEVLSKKFALRPTKNDFMRLVALNHTFGRYDDERQFLLKSFETTSYLEVTHMLRLGELLAASGDFSGAIKVLSQLDRILTPDQERGRILLFDLLIERERTQEALNRALVWFKTWPQPWTGIRLLQTLSSSGATEFQIESLARTLAMRHPGVKPAIARSLISNGHVLVARAILDVDQLKSKFANSQAPDHDTSVALLEASDILADPNLLWWVFAHSLTKPEAVAAQAVFADEIATRFGVDALIPFMDRISNKVLALKPLLAVRLALFENQRTLARRVLAGVDGRDMTAMENKTFSLLKASAF